MVIETEMMRRGGMDVLFNGRKRIDIDASISTVGELITYLRDNELSERASLFVDGNNLL